MRGKLDNWYVQGWCFAAIWVAYSSLFAFTGIKFLSGFCAGMVVATLGVMARNYVAERR
jgi:hypothetical protein